IAERAQIGAQIEVVAGEEQEVLGCGADASVRTEERRVGWNAEGAVGKADLRHDDERQQKEQNQPQERQPDQRRPAEAPEPDHSRTSTASWGDQPTHSGRPRAIPWARPAGNCALSWRPPRAARCTIETAPR